MDSSALLRVDVGFYSFWNLLSYQGLYMRSMSSWFLESLWSWALQSTGSFQAGLVVEQEARNRIRRAAARLGIYQNLSMPII